MRYLIATALITSASTVTAATWTVDDDGTADFDNIQSAVDYAMDGDEILVAPGTYQNFSSTAVIDTAAKQVTILAIGTPEETILDGNGVGPVVICVSGENASTVLEGFTITNGFGEYGGGIVCWNTSAPTITGCTITGNTASNRGGGIDIYNGCNPTITDCNFSNNTAGNGGGIYCWSSSPTITGCTISNNTAGNGGGIDCIYNSSPTFTDCTISDNTVSESGGGIHCNLSSNPTLTNCIINSNTAAQPGGGMACHASSSPTITDCTISGNTTSTSGGGIYCNGSSPTITGCTISGNTAANGGGGGIICQNSSNATLTNCIINSNIASGDGGGIRCLHGSNPILTGCMISGNFAGDLGGGLSVEPGSSCGVQDTSICSNIPTDSQVFGDYTDNGGNTIAEVCPWYQGACCTGNELACVVATEEDCEHFGLTWLGEGTTCDDSPCPTSCLGDVNGDGEVSVNDVLTVIGNWGPCP